MALVAGPVLYGDADMPDQEARDRNTGCSVRIPPCSAGISVDDRRRQGPRGPLGMPYAGRCLNRVWPCSGRILV